MCGIVYVKRKDGKPANRSIRKRYFHQKERGQEGFGYIAIKDNRVVSYKRTQTEGEIMKALEKEDASEILFHHRFPTSTPNIPESAHPIFVSQPGKLDHDYLIVHNGVIQNADELKVTHEALGFKYRTELTTLARSSEGVEYEIDTEFNDSEALAIETALAVDGHKSLIGTRGTAAVIGFQVNEEGFVLNRFFYRNEGNPLRIRNDAVMVSITSLGGLGDTDLVPTERVMLLNAEAAMVPFPKFISTPFCWTSSRTDYHGGTGGGHGFKKHDEEDDKKTTAPLDVPPRGLLRGEKGYIGFHGTSVRDDEDAYGNYDEPTDEELGISTRGAWEMPEGSSSTPASEEDFEFPDPHVRSIGDVAKFELVIKRVDVGSLWDMYDTALGRRDDIAAEVREMDAVVSGNGSIDRDLMAERAGHQATLDRLDHYIEKMEGELTARESIAKIGTEAKPLVLDF